MHCEVVDEIKGAGARLALAAEQALVQHAQYKRVGGTGACPEVQVHDELDEDAGADLGGEKGGGSRLRSRPTGRGGRGEGFGEDLSKWGGRKGGWGGGFGADPGGWGEGQSRIVERGGESCLHFIT